MRDVDEGIGLALLEAAAPGEVGGAVERPWARQRARAGLQHVGGSRRRGETPSVGSQHFRIRFALRPHRDIREVGRGATAEMVSEKPAELSVFRPGSGSPLLCWSGTRPKRCT